MMVKKDTYVGKTFNTKIKAEVGDLLEIAFVDINQYTDSKTGQVWFNYWAPRAIGKKTGKTTSIAELKKMVLETSGQIGIKSVPRIDKVELEELAENTEDLFVRKRGDKWCVTHSDGRIIKCFPTKAEADKMHKAIIISKIRRGVMNKEDYAECIKRSMQELSFKKRFVFQNHYRGKSVHGDLRFERNGNLEGYTLMHQVEGEIKDSVTTIKEANAEDKDDANFKINLKTGELKQDKIEIATKATQPKVWLDIAPGISASGMEAGVGKRPEPGATAKFPGVFTEIDSGTYEEGARKPFYFEYFLNGKVFKGRYIIRQLGAERIKGKEARRPFVWFFWKAKTEIPYVLSARGIRKEYVPEKGRSALPAEWEKKVSNRLKWWKRGLTGDKALAMIKEVRRLLLKGKIVTTQRQEFGTTKFALKRKWWKGQFVIRGMPVEHYELRFDMNKYPFFKLNKNPLSFDKGIVGVKKSGKKAEVMFEGSIPPGKEGNPNKKIPAHVDMLDKDNCNIIEDSENFMHVNFKGKKLKGHWVFKRTDPASNIWLMSKGELPKPSKLSHEFGEPLSEKEKNIILLLAYNKESPSAIAKLIDRPVQTVYDWQKRLYI